LVDPRVEDGDRILTIAMHLWWVWSIFVPVAALLPVIGWAVRQSSSGFADDHGREVINLQLTAIILLVVPPLQLLLIPWVVVVGINSIRASTAAGRREFFRYPLVFRFLK
jgi:uncharacterized Tic20 family protein